MCKTLSKSSFCLSFFLSYPQNTFISCQKIPCFHQFLALEIIIFQEIRFFCVLLRTVRSSLYQIWKIDGGPHYKIFEKNPVLNRGQRLSEGGAS